MAAAEKIIVHLIFLFAYVFLMMKGEHGSEVKDDKLEDKKREKTQKLY